MHELTQYINMQRGDGAPGADPGFRERGFGQTSAYII